MKPICIACFNRHLKDVEFTVVDKAFEACCICRSVEWVAIIKK